MGGQWMVDGEMRKSMRILRRMQGRRPGKRAELAAWVAVFLGMRMPERGLCEHHQTPLDYLEHTFFEGREKGGDALVWACRGGGKTMVGAVATLLDLLFKPGIEVRILGGSLEQSDKMYGYLRGLVRRHFGAMLRQAPTQRRLELVNGSRVDVLAQSDRSVRGTRVQKLRCDEIELFDEEVWKAAQLTTRSLEGAVPVRGAIEAFSTFHRPGGLMQKVLAEGGGGRKVFSWCVWDVIERCPASRECGSCALFDACGGRAKGASGFVKIEDVIAMRGRISRGTWEHEMLCEQPRFEDAVFPGFRREVHVRRAAGQDFGEEGRVEVCGRSFVVEAMVCGVDFGYRHAFVCLWVAMLRGEGGERAAWVVDELVTSERTVGQNGAMMRAREWRPAVLYCDVAGQQVNSQTGRTDESVLREAGFRTRARGGLRIEDGVAAIGELVEPGTGGARLLIDPKCERLIEAMEGYRTDGKGAAVKDGRHDHLIDALRYALVNHEGVEGRVEVRRY